MNIACLGWGSLIWSSQGLPIRGEWFDDGPLLPIEFARESNGKRITLVVADVQHTVRTLWALMSVTTLEEAKSALADREDIKDGNIKYSIGYWEKASNTSHGQGAVEIADWANAKDLDAVVWTNLKYGFKISPDVMPKYAEILKHIRGLSQEERQLAEEYVCRAPLQIDTEYRRNLQRDLGWKPASQK